jgi:protein-disulfide isomerase
VSGPPLSHHPLPVIIKARPMRAFFLCLALGLVTALALAGPSVAAEPLTPDQKAAVEKIIHDYFLQHPDFMVEVLQAAESKLKADKAQDAKQAISQHRDELLHDANTPVAGNPAGDVTIVEFFDYRCPYCKAVEPSLETLLKEDPKLRIVYKEFPVLGEASVYASRMALAARQQDRYRQFHDAMIATKGDINTEVIDRVAKSAGVDVAKAKAAMAAPEIDALIKRNYTLADALDISGTPAFIIGDTLVPGAADIAQLRELIAAARKPG